MSPSFAHLRPLQISYTDRTSSERTVVCIESSYDLLSGRFRCLLPESLPMRRRGSVLRIDCDIAAVHSFATCDDSEQSVPSLNSALYQLGVDALPTPFDASAITAEEAWLQATNNAAAPRRAPAAPPTDSAEGIGWMGRGLNQENPAAAPAAASTPSTAGTADPVFWPGRRAHVTGAAQNLHVEVVRTVGPLVEVIMLGTNDASHRILGRVGLSWAWEDRR